MFDSLDTIAAIATPPGPGGIAILRISGAGALGTLKRLFTPAAGDGFTPVPRRMHYGYALDAHSERLDEVLAVFMPGPGTATGEDVAEIHCHGGPGVTAALLEAAFEAGARPAGPGEFTRRAFLNGRMDLTRAEAVAELISAPTREGARLAAAKLGGALAREIEAVRTPLESLRIQVTLAVDFPDEDAELLSRPAFEVAITQSRIGMARLLAAFERARLWREGAVAVLAGHVNAGKSSLLNALLGRERAIVSSRPGTTRDYIEESVHINGLPVRLIDTAGLRESGDLVEEEGIRRSRDLAEQADLLLFVADVGEPLRDEAASFLRRHADKADDGRLLLVLNKSDTLDANDAATAARLLAAACMALFTGKKECTPGSGAQKNAHDIPVAPAGTAVCPWFLVSARTGQGLDALTAGIDKALQNRRGTDGSSSDIAPNLRQSHLLRQAMAELDALEVSLRAGHPADILGVHLDAAADILGQVTGSSSTEELLDSIFSSFCIGK